MRNLIIIMAFIASFTINAQRNQNEKNDSSFGLKGGYNLASVRNSDGNETDQRQGFHIGFFGESNINNLLAIQIELTYSQQGYVIENSSFKLTQKLDYLNVPFMLKLYPTKTFYLEAGPQIGYLISHKENVETFIGSSDSNFDPHSVDWGANVGLGFKSETGIIFGARYHYGLGKMYEDTNEFNNVLQLSLGFVF
ncbi:porin family protein [Lutibacter sp. TH_r2]|uniref:porin family protein n=1 Tax=Lutibacter sp. TH_r2 TaxID=3082083 RepID=UPI002954891E|nr:porin family protein [Lutibacter sp. TH_r2]MDV7186607.1 porin family protein [Lutibacter sp. TH_r2]